jgi:hypothetical protein
MAHSRLLIATLAFPLAIFCFSSASAQTNDRAQAVREFEDLLGKMKALENRLLVVPAEDQAAFADFLKQPDTGLIRLLPREKYDMKLSIRGGGAFYSFSRLSHEYGGGSDIVLEQGKFSVGFAGYDFGFLIDLGETPIEQATPEHPSLQFLLNFTPPLTELEIREQQRQCGYGLQVGEFSYKSHLSATVGHTYALRSISYDRSDTLVALRVVRQDGDGSVVLIWKTLMKFTAPKPERKNQP